MTLPLINFGGLLVSATNESAKFLGTEDSVFPGTDLWYTVSIFTLATLNPGVDTGWDVVQVDRYGVLRTDVEAAVLNPVPVIQNAEKTSVISIFPYADGTVHVIRGLADIEDAPSGHAGLIELTYAVETYEDGSMIITDASVTDIVSPV